MKNWKKEPDATWLPKLLDVDPTIPDLSSYRIPQFDKLIERDAPPPEMWSPSRPPTMPTPAGPDPFGPIPVLPNVGPPIEVDPPSRPPQWMFGPPEIAEQLQPGPRFPLQALLAVDPSKALSEWASSSARRPATAPALQPIAAAMRQGSMAGLLMDYIRRERQRGGS